MFWFCKQVWWSSSLLSVGIHGLTSIPPPNACEPVCHSVNEDVHVHYTWPRNFTHLWWMLWLTSMGEAIASHLSTQGSLPSLMLADCQTTIFLWHCLVVTPFGSRLDWGGTGTSIWCLVDAHTQGNTSF